jgi:hypothetical protein
MQWRGLAIYSTSSSQSSASDCDRHGVLPLTERPFDWFWKQSTCSLHISHQIAVADSDCDGVLPTHRRTANRSWKPSTCSFVSHQINFACSDCNDLSNSTKVSVPLPCTEHILVHQCSSSVQINAFLARKCCSCFVTTHDVPRCCPGCGPPYLEFRNQGRYAAVRSFVKMPATVCLIS